jgi:hypothetical protein
MTEPDDRDAAARRAWTRLLDLLAREVVRRLRRPDDPELPPGPGDDAGGDQRVGREPH